MSKLSTSQMNKVMVNQRTGRATVFSDVSDPHTQELIRALNSEQAMGTNTIKSQANRMATHINLMKQSGTLKSAKIKPKG